MFKCYSFVFSSDRIRTGTNITSHGYGCAIIDSVARRTAQKVHLSLDGSDVPHDNEEVEMMCVVNIQEQEPEKLNNIWVPFVAENNVPLFSINVYIFHLESAAFSKC